MGQYDRSYPTHRAKLFQSQSSTGKVLCQRAQSVPPVGVSAQRPAGGHSALKIGAREAFCTQAYAFLNMDVLALKAFLPLNILPV